MTTTTRRRRRDGGGPVRNATDLARHDLNETTQLALVYFIREERKEMSFQRGNGLKIMDPADQQRGALYRPAAADGIRPL